MRSIKQRLNVVYFAECLGREEDAGEPAMCLGNQSAFFQLLCTQYLKAFIAQSLEQRGQLAACNVVLSDGGMDDEDREVELFEHGASLMLAVPPD